MSEELEKITFDTEDGEKVEFYVIEQTTIKGMNYLLVADQDEEEANALILKETRTEDSEEAVYDVVENETELNAIAKVFEEILEDFDIETN